jgi:sterol desaturase/sphingolipid hydroxylase (fatty acid hydroxylase superfamily)/Flp pilus assembly pilin Flp
MDIFKSLFFTAVIFIPLERILTLRTQNIFRRHWLNDVVFSIANSYVVGITLALMIVGVTFAADLWLPGVRSAVSSQPGWVQFIEILFLADLGFYWAHRAAHMIPFLWRVHMIHHSVEDLDWLVGARAHPLDVIVLKSASFLPVFILGFSSAALGAFLLLYVWQSVFEHSNVSLRLGPGLRWLLASPEFHHWHHSKDRAARDMNFAGQLPFLDAIFRTAYMPKGRRPALFGIDHAMPQNYVSQLLIPFRKVGDVLQSSSNSNVKAPPSSAFISRVTAENSLSGIFLAVSLCVMKSMAEGTTRVDMRSLVRTAVSWFSVGSERGVTSIEYGLVAALIAIVIILGVTAVGTNLKVVFTTVSGHLAIAV